MRTAGTDHRRGRHYLRGRRLRTLQRRTRSGDDHFALDRAPQPGPDQQHRRRRLQRHLAICPWPVLQVVRKFDAVRAPFEQHLSLLRAFGQLEPDWEQPLEQATHLLSEQRRQRRQQAAQLIARALEDLMSWQEKRTLTLDQIAGTSDATLAETLRERWYQQIG